MLERWGVVMPARGVNRIERGEEVGERERGERGQNNSASFSELVLCIIL
jgi:hypothetical protein